MVENLPANAGDTGSSPGLGRSHMPRSNWALKLAEQEMGGWWLALTAMGNFKVDPENSA